jgi:hypothetical protein
MNTIIPLSEGVSTALQPMHHPSYDMAVVGDHFPGVLPSGYD